MTRDEIIKLAREAAARHGHTLKDQPSPETVEFIVEFAALVAAAEREACAKVCDPEPSPPNEAYIVLNNKATMRKCAAAIRARSNL